MPVGPPRFGPEEHFMFPLTIPGTGGSRVQGHESQIFYMEFFFWRNSAGETLRHLCFAFHPGMDAAALKAVEGIASAGNAKGVFYDN